MLTDTYHDPIRLNKLYWGGLICFAAIFLGYLLATNSHLLMLAVLGTAWLVLLPYHAPLAISLSVATYTSAFILPYFPGRPFVWEFAALLGWSGILVSILMRRYAPHSGRQIRSHKWLFIGAAGYCLVLLITMRFRGFGLRIFGGEQMGGRFYFQQLACAVFPLLFAMSRVNEEKLVRLFRLQCVLSLTFLISDFVFAVAPKELFFLLQFIELPGDAMGFEMQAQNFGIRRFQSLHLVSAGMLYFLLCQFSLKSFFMPERIFLVPLGLSILVVGLFSGHRILMVTLLPTFMVCAYCQRFFNLKHSAFCLGILILVLTFTYAFASALPVTVQRAVSYLPGIDIGELARSDAMGTLNTRSIMREIGLELVPQYLWLGRGFGQAAQDYSLLWDPTGISSHIAIGRFYNGVVGLLVNTGIFGTAFMLLFLGSGTALALKITRLLRRNGCEDVFERLCALLAGLWLANVLAFLLLHGDSEYAMKAFSLQGGLLLVCHRCLTERVEQRDVASSQ